MKKLLVFVLITLALLTTTFSPALAVDTANAAKIFNFECAGCHIKGGNIVRRGKTLKQKALKKYGMDSQEAIANLVANGKNNMPAYKDRLSESEIEDISAYVLEQADLGWH